MRKVNLAPARLNEEAEWLFVDHHLPQSSFSALAREGRALWILADREKVGLMRWGLFWDEIPFLNLIWLYSDCRRKGIGQAAMERWEDSLRKKGYRAAMTSTQSDEQAQHFYRKLGYQDTGGLILTLPGMEQPMEIILIKDLRQNQ